MPRFRAELLTADKRPLSGEMVEHRFSPSAGRNTWLRVAGPDECWIGVFGAGEEGIAFCASVPFGDDDGRTLLIVAGGRGYVLDLETRELGRTVPSNFIQAAISVPTREFVVVADFTNVWCIGRREDRFVTTLRDNPWNEPGRVAHDGIVLESSDERAVSGHARWPNCWYPFELDCDRLEIGFRAPESGYWEPNRAGNDEYLVF